MGVAGIVAGFHKHTLWGVISAWLSGQPLTKTTRPAGPTFKITTARRYYVTTVQHGK